MNTKRGRPKGYSPYTEISYEELADWVGRKTKVPVSKKWLQSLMGTESEEADNFVVDSVSQEDYSEDIKPKIEYTLTEL